MGFSINAFFGAFIKHGREVARDEIFTERKRVNRRYFNRLLLLKNKDTIKRIAKVTIAM